MKPASVFIKVSGYNHARLISALNDADVAVSDFTSKKSGECGFYVIKKDLRKTFAILNDMCYNYSADTSTHFARVLKSALPRLGFAVSLLVFSVLLALSNNYVWRIEISGNETVPDKVIENVLAANNIGVGKKLSGFNGEALSAALRSCDGITLATVSKTGTTVKVTVFESEPASPPLGYSETDVTSKYDATVTRIVTREGTSLVEAGQNVFKGTPLIGAYRTDAEGNTVRSRASGTVYGRVAFTKSETVSTEWYEYFPVKSYSRTRLKIFGLTIGKKPPSGAGISVAESTSKLSVFLPISVKYATITEYEARKMTADIETLAKKREEAVLAEFIDKEICTGFTVSHTVRRLSESVYAVNVFISAETVIGTT